MQHISIGRKWNAESNETVYQRSITDYHDFEYADTYIRY
jgi:hypothetical protein